MMLTSANLMRMFSAQVQVAIASGVNIKVIELELGRITFAERELKRCVR